MANKKLSILALDSHNSKLGGCATTYASPSSCPTDCGLKDAGCYAECGTVALHFMSLDRSRSGLEVTQAEVALIDAVQKPRDRPLRLHTAGDCRSTKAAQILGGAAARWLLRGGGPVWTYTHSWKRIKREAWGGAISVLASIDNPSEALQALKQGYALARVVASMQTGVEGDGQGGKWLSCPAQTQDDTTCRDCKLCWDDGKLADKGLGIQFAAHGIRKNTVIRTIQARDTY